jgi:hypothetical protein
VDADADVRAIEDFPVVIDDGPEVLPEIIDEAPSEPRAWRVAQPRDGVPLHRFLDRAKLSLAEGASLASLVLEAVAAMHESGCGHGALDSRTVRVVPDGTVRLAEWGPDTPFPVGLDDEVRQADIQAAAMLVEEIARSAGRPARPLTEVEERLLARLNSAADPRSLRRRGPLKAARGLDLGIGRTERREAARRGVAELAMAIAAPSPSSAGAAGPGGATGGKAPGARADRKLPPPARRRRPRLSPRIWKGAAVLAVVAFVLAIEMHFFGHSVRRNVSVLTGDAAKPLADPGPRQPDPLPVLGPPAAGPVTHLELRPLESCRPDAVCSAVVQLTVTAQNTPLDVAWGVEIVDRCAGRRESRPGGVLSVPPGKDRAVGTASVALPAGRALALVPVTNSPARVAGVAMPLSARDTTC